MFLEQSSIQKSPCAYLSQQCTRRVFYFFNKARGNKPIRILVRMVQMIWLVEQD